MLEGIDILNDDPFKHGVDILRDWVGEMQMRLNNGETDSVERECILISRRLGTTAAESSILRALSEGGPISRLSLAYSCLSNSIENYKSDVDKNGAPKLIDVYVCKIRKKLPERMSVKSIYGYGYECPLETCDELKRIMSGQKVEKL